MEEESKGYAEAIYIDQQIKEYMGNPLIEALPPVHSLMEAAKLITVMPEFDEKEIEFDEELRIQIIQRLFQFYMPLESHTALERKISAVIRQGYINRNPLTKDNVVFMNNSYRALMEGKIYVSTTNTSKSTQGFTIIGISGTGKSTGIERVLNKYPQVIRHQVFQGKPLGITQIPWMHLECPFDGSIKGLCLQILSELDKLLGTHHFARHGNKSIDYLIQIISHQFRLNNVGLLVIDEIQHLSFLKGGGARKMLDFFVHLINAVGVPVILIGTSKAAPVLRGELRKARRGTGLGYMFWDRMKKDEAWDYFIEVMWKYQWTKKYVPISDEFKSRLYEESQGILDFVIKIFALAQIKAILDGSEEITVELIESVVKKDLQIVKPMLDALRSGDPNEIEKYDDIRTPDFEGIVNNLIQAGEMKNYKTYLKQVNKEKVEELTRAIRIKLLERITNEKIVINAVKKVLNNFNPNNYEFDFLYNEAEKIAEEAIIRDENNKKKKRKEEVDFSPEDLRYLKEQTTVLKQSAYEVFLQNGVIKNPINDFIRGEVM
jgi:hypothetical protein